MRLAILSLLAIGCTRSAAVFIDEDPVDTGTLVVDTGTVVDTALGEGFTDEADAWTVDPEPEPDDSEYDGAFARIVSPQAGELVPVGTPYTYEVELRSPSGALLEPEGVVWQSNIDPDFFGTEASFETDAIDPGVHVLTALVDLPTGARLAHSVSGVRVQDPASGTYAGLFSVDGSVNNITVTCTGAALVEFGPYGLLGEGDADCLVSLLGIDIPMTWLFELEQAGGVVEGKGGVDLLGFFTYDIPVTSGSLDPTSGRLQVDFDGPIPFVGELSGYLDAQRVN